MATKVRRKKVPWAAKERSIMELAEDGHVDTADLIKAARNPDHPCHGDFTWDDAKAAEERRHDQARALIRQCSFEVKYEEYETKVPVFVSNPMSEDREFVHVNKVRSVSMTSGVFAKEIRMLHGLASRVFGLAVAKNDIVGKETVETLEKVCSLIGGLIE